MDAYPLWKNISDTQKRTNRSLFFFFGFVCPKFYHADLDSREQQLTSDLAKKGKFQAKIAFFCFSAEINFGTILLRR